MNQLNGLYYLILLLYYEALYWRPIRPLSYRHSSRLSEIRTQPWLGEWSLTCDPCHHRGPIFNCAPTQIHHQCPCYHIMNDMLECYLWASNHQPFDYWRAHHVYYVASQPRTSDHLISHWRALCLLAHGNPKCNIQSETFTHQNFARAGIRSRVDSGEV